MKKLPAWTHQVKKNVLVFMNCLIVAPFIKPLIKPCIEGCVGHTDRQPIHVAPLRLDRPWQLADILAHRGQHGSYGVFPLGFQIF